MDHSKNFFAQLDQFSSLSLSCSCASPVIELQSKFFPIQPRGGNLTERDLRNAGILPVSLQMSSDNSSSTSPSTPVPVGKLKEPRDLYSTATLLHPIKWPVECQVIPEKIRHIDSVPSKLEPFYNPTGKEPQPQPVGVEMGTVVYDYQPKLSVDYFCRATVGGSQELDQFESCASGENTLKFESRFESGNLAKAIKITNTYYELYLRPDLYTERHAQWFYFRVQGCKEGVQYRFSIVNLNKPDSLYRYGLKVLMYSEKEAQLNGVGWTRCGQNIAYFKNDISLDDNGPYYTLTFNLKFRHNNDTVYLAQCYPYTYSTLQHYLKSIEDDKFKSQLLTIRLLCRSLAGNNVHVLTVTSPDNNCEQQRNMETAERVEAEDGLSSNKKPVIVISARVHPGETQSSYMMKGIIDFLTSDCSQAKELRDRFIFKLIPMLNPDGVIVGNSRCCLLGQDLNRQYRTVLREAFPQIYHAKVMLRRLQEENGIFLYCDLHGHSRRHNVFIYGCENRRVPEKHLMEQVFPLMMHKNAADKFSFQNCKFKIQKNKEGTGRIFVWTLGIVNSYTLEISLGGSTMPSRQYTHFSTGDYEACGRHFCETLLDFSDPSPTKETLRDRILHKLIDEGSTADEPKNVVLSDYSSLSHSETEGDEDDSDRDEDSTGPTGDEGKALSEVKKLSTGNSHKKELKRQVSVRKHTFPTSRNKSLTKTPRNNEFNRSPMPVHRASVDFTQFKHKYIEESFVRQSPVDPIRPNTPENHEQVTISVTAIDKESPAQDIVLNNNSKTKDISAAYKRLTKFRRKSRKSSTTSFTDSLHSSQQLQLTAKCTRILFDDPFNPPGTSWHRPYIGNRQQNVPIMLNGESLGLDSMDFNSNSACQSGTEDECDPYDDMTINRDRNPPTIKITDCDEGSRTSRSISTSQDFLQTLAGDMSRLKVSTSSTAGKFQRSNSDTESGSGYVGKFTAFSPFSPTFPVGKAFLHQNFYPDNPISAGKIKLTSSLSDSTLSDSNAAIASISQEQLKSERVPAVRRSSISYCRSPKTLASGNTTGTSKNTELNSRRRVSWTGTLTVSVPTSVPLLSKSPLGSSLNLNQAPNLSLRKKTFRKSTSLNDKKPGSQQSSTELNDGSSSASLVASVSMDKIYDGRKGTLKGKLRGIPGHSLSAGSISNLMPATSSAKKKRAKLKRSKHK